jgi:hypothetical protein
MFCSSCLQVVKREVIVYGSQDAGPIEALIAWALPFAQRYLRQIHPDMYNKLEENRIRKQLKVLRCSVVDQLFFRYSLQFGRIQSRTRIESGCILEVCPKPLWTIYVNLRVILQIKETFSWELVVLHPTPSTFGKFPGHPWR